MFKEFTKSSIMILCSAREEAEKLKNDYVDTGHILLALLSSGDVRLSQIFVALRIMVKDLAATIVKAMPVGEDAHTYGDVPFNCAGRKVLEFAIEEAERNHSCWVRPEHLLVAVAREDTGVASKVLKSIVTIEELRQCLEDL